MTSPSVPVESREQPREVDQLRARVERQRGYLEGFANEERDLLLQIVELTAERDRARDLAAHLREALGLIARDGCREYNGVTRCKARNRMIDPQPSDRKLPYCAPCIAEAALAAHLEAEPSQQADSK